MKTETMKLCIISMSGGLDSTTLAYRALKHGYKVLPININYGQKNIVEQKAFKNVYKHMVEKYPDWVMNPIDIDLTKVLETSLELYKTIRDSGAVEKATELEFYTPSRNLLFTTIAAMVGEIAAIASGNTEIKIGLGVHKHTQYDRDYWDISPEFVRKINEVFALNDCIDVSMYAPYADKTKDEIVKDAIGLGVPIELTWTCYDPQEVNGVFLPCHVCEACVERQTAGDKASYPHINDYEISVEGG